MEVVLGAAGVLSLLSIVWTDKIQRLLTRANITAFSSQYAEKCDPTARWKASKN